MFGSLPIEAGWPFPTGLVDPTHAIDIGIGRAGNIDEALWLGGFHKAGTPALHGVLP